MTFTLTLPFKCAPSQNTLQRMHFRVSAKLKDTIQFVLRERLTQAGLFNLQRPTMQVSLVIRRYSTGKLDRGNFIGGCKLLLDALRDEGVIRDDNEAYLDDRYEQHECERGETRVEVEVTIPDEQVIEPRMMA